MKAGKKRAAGFSSKVRGVAKNPCDHPMEAVMVKNPSSCSGNSLGTCG